MGKAGKSKGFLLKEQSERQKSGDRREVSLCELAQKKCVFYSKCFVQEKMRQKLITYTFPIQELCCSKCNLTLKFCVVCSGRLMLAYSLHRSLHSFIKFISNQEMKVHQIHYCMSQCFTLLFGAFLLFFLFFLF